MDYRQIKAIEAANKKRILKACPAVPERSGIYFLLREEDGFKYAYIGQAKHLLTRLSQHLSGYQHIDLSLKKHKLWSETNPSGWAIFFIEFPEEQLDEKEKYYIKLYANRGYQMRNKTAGGQGTGKTSIDDPKPAKGYREGLSNGYENARKFVANLFAKHLDYKIKSQTPNKNQEKAKEKFKKFLNGD